MQITYQLTAQDFYHGYMAWRSRRKWQKWLLWTAYFVVATSTLLCMFIVFVDRKSEPSPVDWAGLVFGPVWFTYILIGPRLFSRRQYRNYPIAKSEITLDASDERLEFHTTHGDSRMAWSAYIAWGESKLVFVIMPQARIYVTIPKRSFGEEEIAEFREMLRRNIVTK